MSRLKINRPSRHRSHRHRRTIPARDATGSIFYELKKSGAAEEEEKLPEWWQTTTKNGRQKGAAHGTGGVRSLRSRKLYESAWTLPSSIVTLSIDFHEANFFLSLRPGTVAPVVSLRKNFPSSLWKKTNSRRSKRFRRQQESFFECDFQL